MYTKKLKNNYKVFKKYKNTFNCKNPHGKKHGKNVVPGLIKNITHDVSHLPYLTKKHQAREKCIKPSTWKI